MTLIESFDFSLSVLTVISQVFIIFSIVYILFFQKEYGFIGKFLSKYGLLFAFITVLVATMGSLFYSEIAGYAPCELCWYQRIFMYPQVFLLGFALFKKDKGIIKYAILLSLIGVCIAIYHHLMQIGAVNSLSCPVVGYSVSCAKLFVMKFGYITLPIMASSAFLQTIFFLFFNNQNNNNNNI